MGNAEKISQLTKLVNQAAGYLSEVETAPEGGWQQAEMDRISSQWGEAVHIVRFLIMAYQGDTMGPVHAAEYEALRDRFMAADATIRAMGLDNPFAGVPAHRPQNAD